MGTEVGADPFCALHVLQEELGEVVDEIQAGVTDLLPRHRAGDVLPVVKSLEKLNMTSKDYDFSTPPDNIFHPSNGNTKSSTNKKKGKC